MDAIVDNTTFTNNSIVETNEPASQKELFKMYCPKSKAFSMQPICLDEDTRILRVFVDGCDKFVMHDEIQWILRGTKPSRQSQDLLLTFTEEMAMKMVQRSTLPVYVKEVEINRAGYIMEPVLSPTGAPCKLASDALLEIINRFPYILMITKATPETNARFAEQLAEVFPVRNTQPYFVSVASLEKIKQLSYDLYPNKLPVHSKNDLDRIVLERGDLLSITFKALCEKSNRHCCTADQVKDVLFLNCFTETRIFLCNQKVCHRLSMNFCCDAPRTEEEVENYKQLVEKYTTASNEFYSFAKEIETSTLKDKIGEKTAGSSPNGITGMPMDVVVTTEDVKNTPDAEQIDKDNMELSKKTCSGVVKSEESFAPTTLEDGTARNSEAEGVQEIETVIQAQEVAENRVSSATKKSTVTEFHAEMFEQTNEPQNLKKPAEGTTLDATKKKKKRFLKSQRLRKSMSSDVVTPEESNEPTTSEDVPVADVETKQVQQLEKEDAAKTREVSRAPGTPTITNSKRSMEEANISTNTCQNRSETSENCQEKQTEKLELSENEKIKEELALLKLKYAKLEEEKELEKAKHLMEKKKLVGLNKQLQAELDKSKVENAKLREKLARTEPSTTSSASGKDDLIRDLENKKNYFEKENVLISASNKYHRLTQNTTDSNVKEMAAKEYERFEAECIAYSTALYDSLDMIHSDEAVTSSKLPILPHFPTLSEEFNREWRMAEDRLNKKVENECVCCKQKMNKKREELYRCTKCGQFTHRKCKEDWEKYSQTCMMCKK